jgi:hypothetical protein
MMTAFLLEACTTIGDAQRNHGILPWDLGPSILQLPVQHAVSRNAVSSCVLNSCDAPHPALRQTSGRAQVLKDRHDLLETTVL